jgi:hypothetical protein
MKFLFAASAIGAVLAFGSLAAAADVAEPVAVTLGQAGAAAPLIVAGKPAQVLADSADFPGVLLAVQGLRADLQKVAGVKSPSPLARAPAAGSTVIVGTIGKSALIDQLIASGKLDVSGVKGQWEAYVQQVVDNPLPGVERALVIAGADKRGATFGAYDLSERIGVSPWTWWADVPVPVRQDVAVTPGRRVEKPGVKYRGIFLNDEDPALLSFARNRFGGFNHDFYEKVYELILRMKGNYLWPAMWGKSLFDDDPLNAPLADDMGVVIGTSHHEPMARAHVEWERYGSGPWDYAKNPEALRKFWRDGVVRMGSKEQVVTVGMRGDGDEPMGQGTATQLLETIVADQRKIIGEVTGKDPSRTPQVWALYKEVQDYYDAGMRVPDDVTLLFADDNWGNIRRLPEPGKTRPGGYGVYYHFDYVGGPRNYKWLNTTQVERTWEQLNLAKDYGADQLWVVNVGDLKPMELPIAFFFDQAWNPPAMTVDRMDRYAADWAKEQFGEEHAVEIGALLEGYTRLNARRKPELLAPETFSLVNEREAERVVAEWDDLEARALKVRQALPKPYLDAYFQLVQYPVQASANLTRLHVAAGRNRLYARQGRASAAVWGETVKTLFARDAELTRQFHEDIAGGKWRGMMSQTHIGYTSWQQPAQNVMPEIRTIAPGPARGLGVAVEGSDQAFWPSSAPAPILPILDVDGPQSRWIDIFQGGKPFSYTATASQPWVKLSAPAGAVEGDARLEVSVDWAAAPRGTSQAEIEIRSNTGETVRVLAPVSKPAKPRSGFVEVAGQVAIEAAHYSRAASRNGVRWGEIPGLGRTLSGVTSYPTTARSSVIGEGPYLEYPVDLAADGLVDVTVITAPTIDFRGQQGLRFGVSLGEGPIQTVAINLSPNGQNWSKGESTVAWARGVSDNAATGRARLNGVKGAQKLRLWRIDPGVVFETVVIGRDALPSTYLGPRESVKR